MEDPADVVPDVPGAGHELDERGHVAGQDRDVSVVVFSTQACRSLDAHPPTTHHIALIAAGPNAIAVGLALIGTRGVKT